MKKWNLALGMILISSYLFGQKEVNVNMSVDHATVYLSGAQLFHSKTVSLPAGQSEVIIEGVSNNLDASSLQAGGTGNFTILDVQFRLYYPEPVTSTELPDNIKKKIIKVQDSIQDIDYQLKAYYNRREVIGLQKNMMLANKLLKGEGKNDSLELLISTLAFYNLRMEELLQEELQIFKKETLLNTDKSGMQIRLNDLNNYWAQENAKNTKAPVPQVIVTIMTETAGSAKLELNYLSYSAGWFATYDIKSTDIGQPVRLTYKANIWQNTGIDWKDTYLTFSTGNPTIGNNPPELTTWYLTYYNYYYEERAAKRMETEVAESALDDSKLDSYLGNGSVNAGYAYNHTTQQQTLTNTEFEVKLKYSIPNDGKSHLVALKDESLNADYNYLIVPKLDKDAFLVARITGWEDLGLLPGNANIYYKNSLVGKTSLNTLTLDDTLSVSLGRDRGIEVSRKVLKDKSTDKFIGNDRRVERVYEITIRNSKSISVPIVVMDQIPISGDQSIKVEIGDLDKGELNEFTGIVTWRDKLSSKGKKTIRFSFVVTHPKDKQVQL